MPIETYYPEKPRAPSESPTSLLRQIGGGAIALGLALTAAHERAGIGIAGAGAAFIAIGELLDPKK